MDNETNVQLEETTPTTETNEPENTAEETAETENTEQAENAEGNSSEQESPNENGKSEVESASDEPYLSVRYNKADRNMTKDEAVQYAQKGLMYDKVNPVINKLDYLAAQSDMSVAAFVEKLLTDSDNEHKKVLTERYGEDQDAINEALELHHSKQKSKYDKVVADRKKAEEDAEKQQIASLENRLASEFVELRAEFPDLTEFKNLPDTVKKAAADGKNLTTAYLLYMHRENKKVKAAEAKQNKAANQSAGSQSDKPIGEDSNLDSAFSKGLWK